MRANLPSSEAMVSLAERKALRWYRARGPVSNSEPGAPTRPLRFLLIRKGWVKIAPKRHWFDHVRYEITDAGREVID